MTKAGCGRRVLPLVTLCLAVFLAVSVAVLLPPALETWRQHTSYEQLHKRGLPPSGAIDALDAELNGEDYRSFLKAFAPEPARTGGDAWLFAALVIGYLRLHNVPLWEPSVGALYSPTTRKDVVIEAGDTWATLAEEHLGSGDLWPLLVLLNRDWVNVRGLSLDSGRRIHVAQGRLLGATERGRGE